MQDITPVLEPKTDPEHTQKGFGGTYERVYLVSTGRGKKKKNIYAQL